MSGDENKLIFGSLFQGGFRTYVTPVVFQDVEISSTSSEMTPNESIPYSALLARAKRHRQSASKYRHMARSLDKERRGKAEEVFHLLATNEELEKELDGLRWKCRHLLQEKMEIKTHLLAAEKELKNLKEATGDP